MIHYEGKNQSVDSNSEITPTIVLEKNGIQLAIITVFLIFNKVQERLNRLNKNKRFIVT